MKCAISILGILFSIYSFALEPDWSEGAKVPLSGRPNPYELNETDLLEANRNGRLHALIYPVNITGILIPQKPISTLLAKPKNDFVKKEFLTSFEIKKDIKNLDELYEWLGMRPYPGEKESGVYSVPYPSGKKPEYRMGVSVQKKNGATAITFGCASCHSGHLFGKEVLGLTARFPRANQFFGYSKAALERVSPFVFQFVLGATSAEKNLYSISRDNTRFVDSKHPQTLGLDTSLAHTALSLARRAPDGEATKDAHYAENPTPEPLSTLISDGKPLVWWNVKYKNRWLADGSVVSGNPIYTNFLWNEIGRGTDLKDLREWLDDNQKVVGDLTTAVFASEAPLFTDFFPPTEERLARAKKGEKIFLNNCAACHGTYVKNWDLPTAESLSLVNKMKTYEVKYHATTPVIDVGTDSARYLAIPSLANRLNALNLSQEKKILVTPQKGYVPPPLVGVWARWPYFHNNSAPTLCAVLTKGADRPSSYYAGEAFDASRHFDSICNGYPTGAATPKEWKDNAEALYDTSKAGMTRFGHDERIFLNNGKELLTSTDKEDLIIFLQTL